jgi:hypothetical protein
LLWSLYLRFGCGFWLRFWLWRWLGFGCGLRFWGLVRFRLGNGFII